MSKAKDLLLPVAIVVTALYIGAGGAAKLAGIPYVHSSFPKLGLPPWFGYFIGTCEVLEALRFSYGPSAPWRPLDSS